MRKTILLAAAMFTISSAAFAQDKVTTYRECISRADVNYKASWKEQCHRRPEVKTRDEADCELPMLIATSLNNDLKMQRELCSQATAAGVLK